MNDVTYRQRGCRGSPACHHLEIYQRVICAAGVVPLGELLRDPLSEELEVLVPARDR